VIQSTLQYGVEDRPLAEVGADALWLWPCACVVAVLATELTFAARPGINWLLTLSAVLAACLLCVRVSPEMRARSARLSCIAAMALALVLAGSTTVTDEGLLKVLALAAILALAAFVVLLSVRAEPGFVGVAELAFAPLLSGRAVAAEAIHRTSEALVLLRAGPCIPVLRGLLLSVPVLAVLFVLLSAADPTLDDWRTLAIELMRRFIAPARLTYFILWLGALLGACGLALQQAQRIAHPEPARVESPGQPVLLGVERLIVLGSMIALFTLFFALRLSALFGSIGARLGSGVTLAQATHQGFAELTVAAMSCAGVILGLERFARRGSHEARIRLFADIVIAQALLLLGSAYQRVALYEAAYGYTAERLAVQLYCLSVGIGLLLLAYELHRGVDLARLVRRSALSVFALLAAVCYLNPASYIVAQNLARYQATGRLDTQYLAQLAGSGSDAIPELVRALPELPGGNGGVVRAALANAARSLGQTDRWYEWNLRREQARAALHAAGFD
jgi:hypothetical protein